MIVFAVLRLYLCSFFELCDGDFGTRGEVRGSLVVLAVERSFLCSFLRGVSCGGCGRVFGFLAVDLSSLCGSL